MPYISTKDGAKYVPVKKQVEKEAKKAPLKSK